MTTLTPEDRARLRDLAAKATPGPWEAGVDDLTCMANVHHDQEQRFWVADTGPARVEPTAMADSELIAAMRNALPALLDALDEAERERDEWERAAMKLAASSNAANANLYDAQAAIERVRDLHRPETGMHGTTVCAHRHCTDDSHDQCEYPCATVRALDGGGES